jgi:hypothetical protein
MAMMRRTIENVTRAMPVMNVCTHFRRLAYRSKGKKHSGQIAPLG